jgi:hypothetical protein
LSRAPPERDLLQQVAREICEQPVDWERALDVLTQGWCAGGQEAAGGDEVCLIDFGPGGGSGALNLVRHIPAADLGQSASAAPPQSQAGTGSLLAPGRASSGGTRIDACYFTQLWVDGPLPESWLAWSRPAGDSPGRGLVLGAATAEPQAQEPCTGATVRPGWSNSSGTAASAGKTDVGLGVLSAHIPSAATGEEAGGGGSLGSSAAAQMTRAWGLGVAQAWLDAARASP